MQGAARHFAIMFSHCDKEHFSTQSQKNPRAQKCEETEETGETDETEDTKERRTF